MKIIVLPCKRKSNYWYSSSIFFKAFFHSWSLQAVIYPSPGRLLSVVKVDPGNEILKDMFVSLDQKHVFALTQYKVKVGAAFYVLEKWLYVTRVGLNGQSSAFS